MKTNLPVLGLLVTLALAGPLAAAPTIPNPSFEANAFTVFPGYHHQAGNGAITGWTPSGGAGLNPAAGSPFADNGVVPNGSQVAFIQNGADSFLSTVISDLTIGETYKVNFRVNARGGNTPNLKVDIDGVNVINTAVTSVGGANPYKYFAFDFTATAASQTMTLRNDAGGDNTVVLDDFSIATRNSGWSYAAWSDDATSGVDGTKTYTHAYDFGSAAGTTINGIAFTGIAGGNPSVPAVFSTAGLPNVFNNDGNNVIEGSRQLANDFLYGGAVQSVTIDGLTFGKSYVATIYSVDWDSVGGQIGTRAATFSVGNDRLTVNQDHFGENNGIRVTYAFTAAASSITLTFVPLQGNTFHTYGFSNYEVPPPQIVNPSFEADTFATWPGYVSGNGPITGWSAAGGAGLNPVAPFGAGDHPFADNGTTPDGRQIAFIQEDSPLRQVISGFIVGAAYQVRYFENARTGGTAPACTVSIGGNIIVSAHIVTPVGGGNPYREVISDSFVATATSLELAFVKSNPQGGDTTLLIDHVSIVPPNTAPTITLQPQDATIGLGDTATFTVGAAGSAPLTYQWYFGSDTIAGGTSPTLNVVADFPDVAGDYLVIVANGAGSVTSRVARLTVRDKVTTLFNTGVDEFGVSLPSGTVDPHWVITQSIDPGFPGPNAEVLNDSGFPIPPWLANDEFSKWIAPQANQSVGNLEGDYNYRSTFDLAGFDPASIRVTGEWATDNTGTDILINGVSTSQRNDSGFAGWTPFQINSGFLAGVNMLDFRVNNAPPGVNPTGFRVRNLRGLGTALPAGTAPFIVAQPQSVNPPLGSRVTFLVRANGSGPLSYQWFYGNDALPGETRPELTFTLEFPDQAGDYRVEIRNSFGLILSSTAVLTVRDAPLIVTQPQSQAVAVGDTVNFTVTADGAEPLSYQWTKNGSDIPGANGPTLTLNGVTLGDSAAYAVRVSNFAGTATSADAILTVLEAIPGLFNTGVDGSGVSLPSGTVDPHWTITASVDPGFPGPDAVVLNDSGFPIPPWLANDEISKWIAPRADQSAGNLEGDYNYRTTFNPAGFDPASVRVTGEWATDNAGTDILINGVSTGQRNDGQFVVWTAFQINSGFVAGANTLDFKVNNAPTAVNPTGFRVRNIRALGVRLAIQPPTVAISSPANGATLPACVTATICAEASAAGGASIAQVVFIAAGVGPIGVATTAPYCVNVPNAPAGAYVLTAIATDSNGNSTTSAPVNVTVVDGPPVVTCPGDIAANATSAAGAVVNYVATASDLCGAASLICAPASGSTFPVGATDVNCTATDGAGNTSRCTFKVTVRSDNQPPVAVISSEQLINLQPEFENPVLISCNWWNACLVADGWTSSDPEGGDLTYLWSLENDPVPFGNGPVVTNCLEVGTHTIILMVTDPAGLTGTTSKTIEVVTAPLAIELLIEQIDESHKSGVVLSRKIKRELTETLRVALRFAGEEKLRETQKALDAFEKKVRAQVAPTEPEAATAWVRFSQAVSEGMEKCIKPPRKHKQHDPKDPKDPKDPADPQTVTVCHQGSSIEVRLEDLQAHLDHGDTLGPCNALTVPVCHLGTTIEVRLEDLQAHLDHGDTLGACEN